MTDESIFPRPLKALYHSFGCKLNFAETASVADAFAARGVTAVTGNEIPDIIVVNTCSVTHEADRKCRTSVRSFNRRYPEALILVTGCYAQLHPEDFRDLPGVGIVAGVNDKLALVDCAEVHAFLFARRPHALFSEGAGWLRLLVHILHDSESQRTLALGNYSATGRPGA